MVHQVHVYCIAVPDTPTAAVTHIQTSTVRRVPLFPNVTLRQKREIKPPSLVYCFVSAVPPADPHTHVRTHPPTTKSHTTNMTTPGRRTAVPGTHTSIQQWRVRCAQVQSGRCYCTVQWYIRYTDTLHCRTRHSYSSSYTYVQPDRAKSAPLPRRR